MSAPNRNDGHPRPRIGKTRDDRLKPSERTRGGRQEKKEEKKS